MKIFSVIPIRVEQSKTNPNWHYINSYRSWTNYVNELEIKIDSLDWFLKYYHSNYNILTNTLNPNSTGTIDDTLIKFGYLSEKNGTWTFNVSKLKYKEGLYNNHNMSSIIHYGGNKVDETFPPGSVIFQKYRPEGKSQTEEDNEENGEYLLLPLSASDFFLITSSEPNNLVYKYVRNSLFIYGDKISLNFELTPRRYNYHKQIIWGNAPIKAPDNILSDQQNKPWTMTFPLYSNFYYETKDSNSTTVEDIIFDSTEQPTLDQQILYYGMNIRNPKLSNDKKLEKIYLSLI